MNDVRTTVMRCGAALAAATLLVVAGLGVSKGSTDGDLAAARSLGAAARVPAKNAGSAHAVITADLGGVQVKLQGDISFQDGEASADLRCRRSRDAVHV